MSYYIRIHGGSAELAKKETKEQFSEFVKRAGPEHRADEAVITDAVERMIGILPELAPGQEYSIILSGSYAYDDNLDKQRGTGIRASLDVAITGERWIPQHTGISSTMASPYQTALSMAAIQKQANEGKLKPGDQFVLPNGDLVTIDSEPVDTGLNVQDNESDPDIPPLIERIKRKMSGYMGNNKTQTD